MVEQIDRRFAELNVLGISRMGQAYGIIDRMDLPHSAGVPALPPTQEQLPYDDGEPMESDRHYEQMHLLTNTLKLWLRSRPEWYVAGNRAVYFSLEQARNQDFRAPDVFVVTGVEDGHKERLSWVVWEEGGRFPHVVIEILSPSTEHEDRGRKKKIYAEVWQLPEYFVFEPFSARLEGWDLDPRTREYVPKQRDLRGDLPVHQLKLALGLRELECYGLPPPSLRWILPDGTPLPTGEEYAEHAQAQAEHARAQAEHARAQAEHARAQAEHARTQAEAAQTRAESAEAEVRELREALARRTSG